MNNTQLKKRGIKLKMTEQEKYERVKRFVDNKKTNHHRLAVDLCCSLKHTYVKYIHVF